MEEQVPVTPLLASLAASEQHTQDQPDEGDVDQAARTWQLTPTEAYLAGKAAGLAQAQDEVREKAGLPVEKESHRM